MKPISKVVSRRIAERTRRLLKQGLPVLRCGPDRRVLLLPEIFAFRAYGEAGLWIVQSQKDRQRLYVTVRLALGAPMECRPDQFSVLLDQYAAFVSLERATQALLEQTVLEEEILPLGPDLDPSDYPRLPFERFIPAVELGTYKRLRAARCQPSLLGRRAPPLPRQMQESLF